MFSRHILCAPSNRAKHIYKPYYTSNVYIRNPTTPKSPTRCLFARFGAPTISQPTTEAQSYMVYHVRECAILLLLVYSSSTSISDALNVVVSQHDTGTGPQENALSYIRTQNTHIQSIYCAQVLTSFGLCRVVLGSAEPCFCSVFCSCVCIFASPNTARLSTANLWRRVVFNFNDYIRVYVYSSSTIITIIITISIYLAQQSWLLAKKDEGGRQF